MSNRIKVERSIHYALNEYQGKANCFDEITPMFIGYQTCPLQGVKGPFKRFNYVIHVIGNGEGVFVESGIEHHLKTGDVFIVKPHVPTYYKYQQDNELKFAWIGFSGSYAKKLDSVKSVHRLSPSYFNDIKNLIDNNDTVYAEHVIEILMRLTDEILASDSDGLLKLVKDYIDDNYNKPISIENVAKQFSYTRTYLSHIFKKQYGFSPKEYLMNKRLSEALNMILQGKKIKVVCNAVGFSNEYNFSRYFKLKYGVSPNNYLRKTKKTP